MELGAAASRQTEATVGGRTLGEYFRLPGILPDLRIPVGAAGGPGYFRIGSDMICYGAMTGGVGATSSGRLPDAREHIVSGGESIALPFDPGAVINNLQYERYAEAPKRRRWIESRWSRSAYYSIRPVVPDVLRRGLQRFYFRNWDSIVFPGWPVDRTADALREKLLGLVMKHLGVDRVPFVWFWPDGHSACAIVTHDVETRYGRDHSIRLMDIDAEFGIPASFQVVPEKRYDVALAYLDQIRSRGFELNVHGLDHDGNLFDRQGNFLERARRINEYARRFGSEGFRSPSMYRDADLFQHLEFAYDMSVPSVARLEPQRGGCCTVMPYFLPGGMLELPLTTCQDYTLFYILRECSTSLWKEQISVILENHGMMSFLVHPDYVSSDRSLDVYRELLRHLRDLALEQGVWLASPGDVNRWWRDRSRMEAVSSATGWRIEGDESGRARIAWAHLDGDRIGYEIP